MTDIDTFINQQTSPNTRRAYRNDLIRWVAFLDGRIPTVDLVVQFKDGLENALAPASARRTFSAVRSFYNWVGLTPNPFDRVKPPTTVKNATPKVPSNESVDALLDAIDTSTLQGKRDRAIVTLLLNNLRASEVADLGRDDLYFESEYKAWVLRVVGKGKKERFVPANEESVEAVRLFQLEAQRVTDRLLYDHDGSALTYRQVEEAVYRAAKVAGLEGMHPHALRHHYATRLARKGINIIALQKLLGHSRADTTQQYVTLDLSDLIEAVKVDPRAQVDEPAPTLRLVASA